MVGLGSWVYWVYWGLVGPPRVRYGFDYTIDWRQPHVGFTSGNLSSLVPHPQLKLVNKFGNLNSIKLLKLLKLRNC